MQHPNRHSGDPDYCGTSVDGDYWEGLAHVSMIDSNVSRIVNTITIAGLTGNTARIPFSVSKGYYHVPRVEAAGRGRPQILWLRDFPGEGAGQFTLFRYEACGLVAATVIGYDPGSQRVVQYPVELRKEAGAHRQFWIDQVFSAKPTSPGHWSLDWSPGHGTDYRVVDNVSFDATQRVFVDEEKTINSYSALGN